jgi:CBS domain containing-hemolysin-like protein
MYIMYPIAYPTALLLDYFLGESHGTIYKKAGKTEKKKKRKLKFLDVS